MSLKGQLADPRYISSPKSNLPSNLKAILNQVSPKPVRDSQNISALSFFEKGVSLAQESQNPNPQSKLIFNSTPVKQKETGRNQSNNTTPLLLNKTRKETPNSSSRNRLETSSSSSKNVRQKGERDSSNPNYDLQNVKGKGNNKADVSVKNHGAETSRHVPPKLSFENFFELGSGKTSTAPFFSTKPNHEKREDSQKEAPKNSSTRQREFEEQTSLKGSGSKEKEENIRSSSNNNSSEDQNLREKKLKVDNTPEKEEKENQSQSFDRYDFYSEKFTLKSVTFNTFIQNFSNPQSETPKKLKEEKDEISNFRKGTSHDQIKSSLIKPLNISQKETKSSFRKESPKCEAGPKVNASVDGLMKNISYRSNISKNQSSVEPPQKTKNDSVDDNRYRKFPTTARKESPFLHKRSNPICTIVTEVGNFTEMNSEETEMSRNHLGSASKLKNLLLEPSSLEYGKFGKIYKGIENRDSWKFDFSRFKKLERGSSPMADVQKTSFNRKSSNETTRIATTTRHNDSPYNLEVTARRENTQERIKENLVKTVKFKSMLTEFSEKRMQERTPKEYEQDSEEHIEYDEYQNPEIEEEVGGNCLTDVCEDTLNFLVNLNEKGFYGRKDEKNKREIQGILEGLKREANDLKVDRDQRKKEELEGKILFLLDMTVQDLSTLMANKDKSPQKFQGR